MNKARGDYSRWEEYYRRQDVEKMPWYYPGLDPDIELAISMMDIHSGSILDLCTGPGTQAIALARRGFSVTASDIADTAVRKACERARKHGYDITFRQNDLFDNSIEESFDYVIDRGCYHLFPKEARKEYPAAVARLINPGGYLFLKCFSHREKGEEGPYRVHPAEIREVFSPLFKVMSIRDTIFQSAEAFGSRRSRYEPRALFCIMRRR